MASVVELLDQVPHGPIVVGTVEELRDRLRVARRAGARIGFVPTMGYLHAGHQALMDRAREACDLVVASIYVNPTQFGPSEDYATYPRDLDGDSAIAGAAGVDVLFVPSTEEMYPAGAEGNRSWVEVGGLTSGLCGRFRPGHFRGVTTVVTRLFLMVQPDVAYFGEKDLQQLAVIRRMVRDLGFPIRVVGVPTVREPDGLAMSSRNAYLSADAREQALVLSEGLRAAQTLYAAGERRVEVLEGAVRDRVARAPLATEQYIELVDSEDLTGYETEVTGDPVLAVAVWLDKTRLIDNARLRGPKI